MGVRCAVESDPDLDSEFPVQPVCRLRQVHAGRRYGNNPNSVFRCLLPDDPKLSLPAQPANGVQKAVRQIPLMFQDAFRRNFPDKSDTGFQTGNSRNIQGSRFQPVFR